MQTQKCSPPEPKVICASAVSEGSQCLWLVGSAIPDCSRARGSSRCCRQEGGGLGTCGRALTEVMPQPRAGLSPLGPSCSPLRQLSRAGALRGPVTPTGAAARTSPTGHDCTIACRGHAVPREQGGLAKAAPGAGNSTPSPSSSSAAANAAAFA